MHICIEQAKKWNGVQCDKLLIVEVSVDESGTKWKETDESRLAILQIKWRGDG